MNKILVYLLFTYISHNCIAFDAVDKRAARADCEKDFFVNELQVNGEVALVTSYFNLTPYKEQIGQVFSTNNNAYDIRSLEKSFCRLSQATMPLYTLHRGKIGVCTGAAATILALIIYKKISSFKYFTWNA